VTYEVLCQELEGVLRGVVEVRKRSTPDAADCDEQGSTGCLGRVAGPCRRKAWHGARMIVPLPAARAARLDGRMAETIDRHLERMAEVGAGAPGDGRSSQALFAVVR
jgi:hypothetical protein